MERLAVIKEIFQYTPKKKILQLIMKIKYLQNVSVLIENQGEKILCDPWLIDGCYYGSRSVEKFEI